MKEAKPKPTLQKSKGANATAVDDHKLHKEEDTSSKANAEEGDQALGSSLNHHHHLTQYIPLIAGSEEGWMATDRTPVEKDKEVVAEGDQAMGSALTGRSKVEESGRERLKRHRVEVAGEVWIPDIWGQEDFLEDWIDCAAFDSGLEAKRIMSARAAMVEQGRRAHSSRVFSVENSC